MGVDVAEIAPAEFEFEERRCPQLVAVQEPSRFQERHGFVPWFCARLRTTSLLHY